MNYFYSERVYLALPSVFFCFCFLFFGFFFFYFWRDSASSLVPGGVWRVKRVSFGILICGNDGFGEAELWPGSQCHRVGCAFSTSGIPCSFYWGFEGFSSSLPDSGVTMGFFPQMSKLLLGIPGAWVPFLCDRTDPYPQQGQSLWQMHTFNNDS